MTHNKSQKEEQTMTKFFYYFYYFCMGCPSFVNTERK